jgi:hypothetical protein
MKPVRIAGAPVTATKAAGTATDTAAAAELAKAARPGAGAAGAARTGAAAASGGSKPPPPKRDAVTGEPATSDVPLQTPTRPAETVEDFRAAQRKTREANPVPEFLARQNQPGRTFTQAAMDVARSPFVGSMIEDVVGSDRYSRAKAAVSEYVPDVVRSAASYVPPILAGPFGSTTPATAVAFSAGGDAVKQNIAGREVVVYPNYAMLRADDRGPARDVRLAREAPTPAQFGARRDMLRRAFEQAKKDYSAQTESTRMMAREGTTSDKQIEDAALLARKRLQKVVDLREALRELQEPEDRLKIQ